VHVLAGADGAPLADIRTVADNLAARDRIFDLVRDLTRDPEVAVHASLAGGRKTMGFLLGAALQFMARPQDRLYHVLVHPAAVERPNTDFYFPSASAEPVRVQGADGAWEPLCLGQGEQRRPLRHCDVDVELAELPLCRVGHLVEFAAPGRYDPEALVLVQEAIDAHVRDLRAEYQRRALAAADDAFPEIVGQSPAMRHLKRDMAAAAAQPLTVLIVGETGTGKELVATGLHKASGRPGRLVRFNCGAIPQGLAESTLFGHERGAFTGALARQVGVFEQARDGTLFLDEIDSLPLALQPQLLRVLESGRITRVGGQQEIEVNARVLAATNADLERQVADGRFRQDLYYRLAVYRLRVPPLRERPEDIPALALELVAQAARRSERPCPGLTAAALDWLRAAPWPGNVRQLRNCLERALVHSPTGALLGLEDVAAAAADLPLSPAPATLADIVAAAERNAIVAALARAGGNRQAAARELGIDRTTVGRRMRQYGLA